MNRQAFQTRETAWCPGCGNFGILSALKNTLEGLDLDPHDVLIVGGIGQAAKMPQYFETNSFCGLHGRAVPAAVAAKIVNPRLTVIINSGDGDTYGEGGIRVVIDTATTPRTFSQAQEIVRRRRHLRRGRQPLHPQHPAQRGHHALCP